MPTLTSVEVTAVQLTPNPVNFNAALRVTVTAVETSIELPPEIAYSGECYSGENYAQGG